MSAFDTSVQDRREIKEALLRIEKLMIILINKTGDRSSILVQANEPPARQIRQS